MLARIAAQVLDDRRTDWPEGAGDLVGQRDADPVLKVAIRWCVLIDAGVDARMVEKVRPPERNGLFRSIFRMQSGVCLVNSPGKLKKEAGFLT